MALSLIGDQLGGYNLAEEIGRGGAALVYHATRPDPSRQFAVKVLSPLAMADETARRRFRREISVMSQLSHPNILPIIDSGEEPDGTLYLVMPLVDQGSLRQILAERRALTPAETLRIAGQVAAALDYAHSKGIIHRDIKPHNVMLMPDGSIRLADFGVAEVLSLESTVTNLTTTGTTVGTFAYMSPEQVSGQDIDSRADVFALAIVLYQCLLGRLPYSADSTAAALTQKVHARPIPPGKIDPDFPPAVEAVLLKGMAVDRENRYATAGELADALEKGFRRLSAEAMAAPLVSPLEIDASESLINEWLPTVKLEIPAEERRRRRRWLAGVVVVLLSVLLLLSFLVVRPLQQQIVYVRGTADALASRPPVMITVIVTNEAGQIIIIEITSTPGATPTPTATAPFFIPTATPTATRTPTVSPTAPTATAPPPVVGGDGVTTAPTNQPGGTNAPLTQTPTLTSTPGTPAPTYAPTNPGQSGGGQGTPGGGQGSGQGTPGAGQGGG